MSGKGELLPCPFCGSAGKVDEGDWGFYVTCEGETCMVEMGLGESYYERWGSYDTYDLAAAAWNTRAK